MTGAERSRRYREKQKAALAAEQIKRDATEIVDPNRVYELTELLRNAVAERDYYKEKARRLEQKNDELLARAVEAERFHTITLKDLIATRKELAELQRKAKASKK